jgi:hypothetical protein
VARLPLLGRQMPVRSAIGITPVQGADGSPPACLARMAIGIA